MKKHILLTINIILIFCGASMAQTLTTNKIPPAVIAAYKAKFPAAQQPSWDMEKKDVYEVAFIVGKKTQTAQFDNTGKWLETETEINYNAAPAAVKQSLQKEFDGFNIQIVYLVETADKGNQYEISVFKGKENYEVLFAANGKIISKEKGKEGDDE